MRIFLPVCGVPAMASKRTRRSRLTPERFLLFLRAVTCRCMGDGEETRHTRERFLDERRVVDGIGFGFVSV